MAEPARFTKPLPVCDQIDALLAQQTLPSFEVISRMIKDQGYRISNLFHRMDGQWQANLRSRDSILFFEFAYGVTAGDALLKALKKAARGQVAKGSPVAVDDVSPLSIGSTMEPVQGEPAAVDDDLLGAPEPEPEDDDDLLG